MDFQSYSLSISYRISGVVHGGVGIFWNNPFLTVVFHSAYEGKVTLKYL